MWRAIFPKFFGRRAHCSQPGIGRNDTLEQAGSPLSPELAEKFLAGICRSGIPGCRVPLRRSATASIMLRENRSYIFLPVSAEFLASPRVANTGLRRR